MAVAPQFKFLDRPPLPPRPPGPAARGAGAKPLPRKRCASLPGQTSRADLQLVQEEWRPVLPLVRVSSSKRRSALSRLGRRFPRGQLNYFPCAWERRGYANVRRVSSIALVEFRPLFVSFHQQYLNLKARFFFCIICACYFFFVRKQWLKPQLSAKAVARLRKQAIISGADWPWDTPKKPIKVHDVDRKKRADTIARYAFISCRIYSCVPLLIPRNSSCANMIASRFDSIAFFFYS